MATLHAPLVPTLPAAAAVSPATLADHAKQAEFDSRELMRGGREVLIRHAGQVYRLRHTRNDKLILVK
jgi:hemin uptake protein HemP